MFVRRPLACSLTAIALAASVAAPTAARAGTPTEAELAQARERFAAARKLEDTGHWAEALTLFQRIAEVKTTPQVRFHIALCMENVGLWTQALDGYAQAASEAGAGAPEVVKESNEHVRKLQAAMPTVSLNAPGAAADDEIYVDRRRVAQGGQPPALRTDPGPHTAELRRGDAVLAREIFALEPRTTRRIELRIGSVTPAPDATVGAPASNGRAQRIAGWSVIGVGAASLIVTGVFVGLRAGAMNRLEAQCPGLTRCPPEVASVVSEGKTDAALVNVFAVLGGVAAATGVTLLVTAPSAAPVNAARLELTPAAGPGGFGLFARGLF